MLCSGEKEVSRPKRSTTHSRMDPLNDERTNLMAARVHEFHENCLKFEAQSALVLKRESKSSLHYLKFSERIAKLSQDERNKTLKFALKTLSETISEIQTYRETYVVARIQLLQKRIRDLDETCNIPTSALLKDRNLSVKSSIKYKEQVEVLASKNTSQKKLDKKMVQLQAEEKRVYTIDKGLQTNILKYEEKRIKDMRAIMENYIKGQISFHCRAIELLSKAMKSTSQLDSWKAVEELCLELNISAKQLNFKPAAEEREEA